MNLKDLQEIREKFAAMEARIEFLEAQLQALTSAKPAEPRKTLSLKGANASA